MLVKKHAELRLARLAPSTVSLGMLDESIAQLGRRTLATPLAAPRQLAAREDV